MSNIDLKKFRRQIDNLDKKLILILTKRFRVVKKISRHKKKYNLPVQDIQREKEMFVKRNTWARKYGIEKNLVKEIFQLIVKAARKKHKKVKFDFKNDNIR